VGISAPALVSLPSNGQEKEMEEIPKLMMNNSIDFIVSSLS
jgi:hypothetical protein